MLCLKSSFYFSVTKTNQISSSFEAAAAYVQREILSLARLGYVFHAVLMHICAHETLFIRAHNTEARSVKGQVQRLSFNGVTAEKHFNLQTVPPPIPAWVYKMYPPSAIADLRIDTSEFYLLNMPTSSSSQIFYFLLINAVGDSLFSGLKSIHCMLICALIPQLVLCPLSFAEPK